MAFCLHCGVENPDEARYCHNCGVELLYAQTPTPRPETVVEGVPNPDDRAQRAGGTSGSAEPRDDVGPPVPGGKEQSQET
ncbi:MAG: zinc-ribbon domain-containing protein [Actinomycetota bacterium]|nr:zinc-ribbon domain-containing protein [Actinomycetota bacterium]